jgi:hypothetical protein
VALACGSGDGAGRRCLLVEPWAMRFGLGNMIFFCMSGNKILISDGFVHQTLFYRNLCVLLVALDEG